MKPWYEWNSYSQFSFSFCHLAILKDTQLTQWQWVNILTLCNALELKEEELTFEGDSSRGLLWGDLEGDVIWVEELRGMSSVRDGGSFPSHVPVLADTKPDSPVTGLRAEIQM